MLKQRAERGDTTNVVLVTLADAEAGRAFLERLWPEARVVSDPEQKLYDDFGIGRMKLWQLLDPRMWLAGVRAVLRGNGVGRPSGDPFRMSASFLIEGDRVLREHHDRFPGDHADLDTFCSLPR